MCCEMPATGTVSENDVKARKDHKCCECGKTIKKGALYSYFKACYPGADGWDSFKTCRKCKSTRQLAIAKWPPVYDDEGPAFGELYCWIREARG